MSEPRLSMSKQGTRMHTKTLTADQTWAQVGWLGQSGAVYDLDEPQPIHAEPGSYAPLWLLLENDPPIVDEPAPGEVNPE